MKADVPSRISVSVVTAGNSISVLDLASSRVFRSHQPFWNPRDFCRTTQRGGALIKVSSRIIFRIGHWASLYRGLPNLNYRGACMISPRFKTENRIFYKTLTLLGLGLAFSFGAISVSAQQNQQGEVQANIDQQNPPEQSAPNQAPPDQAPPYQGTSEPAGTKSGCTSCKPDFARRHRHSSALGRMVVQRSQRAR